MYIYHEYQCKKCNTEWEDFVEKSDVRSPCPTCGKVSKKPVLSAPNISALSAMSPEMYREKMKQRSADHSKKHIAANSDDPKYRGFGKAMSREGKIQSK